MIRKRSLTHLMLQFQSIRLTNPSISKTFFRSTPNPHCRWFSSSVFLNQSRLFVQHYCPWILSSSGTRCGFTGFRGMATRSMTDSSNRPPKETILLDGCDFEHWLVVTDPPDPNLTRDEIIDGYIKTLAKVVGSEEEARMKIYSVSTKHYFAFGALVSEELSYKLKELPGIRWVLPDSYLDVPNKSYGGEPFIDGRAVPYDPKYHEEWVRNHNQSLRNNAKQRDKRRSDRVSRREMTGNTSMPPPPPPPAPQAAYPASPPPSTPSPFSSQNIATTYGSTSQPSPSSRFPSAPQASNLVSPAAPSGGINQSMETAPGYQNQQPGIQNKSFPHTNQGWNISAPAQSHELSGGNGSYPNQGMPPPFTSRNYLGQDMPPPAPQNRNYPSQGMAPPPPPPPQNRSYPSQDMPPPPPPPLNRDCPSQGMTPPLPPPQNRSYPSQGMPPPPPPNRSFPSQGMPPPPPPPQRNYQSQGMPPPPPQRNYLNQGIPPPPLQNTNYPSQDMPSPVHNRNYPDQNMPPPSPPPPQYWNSPPTMQNQHFQNRDVPQQNYYNRGSPPPFQNHGNQPAGFPNRDFRSQEMGGFRGNESESRPTLDEDYNAVAK